MPDEKWCPWHVILVESVPDDTPEQTVLHPNCPFTVSVHHGMTEWNYACEVQYEIDNCGLSILLGDYDQTVDGMYRARMRHYTIRGPDWSEVSVEYEVEQLAAVGASGTQEANE